MRQSQQPNPAKKAKAQHPPKEVDADAMNPEDDIWLSSGKHPNRQCGESLARAIVIRFSQHDVLTALPSVFALHSIFSHSDIYGTLCNLNHKGPSRYRPEVDLRLNAQINLGSFQHNGCRKDELTLFSKAVCQRIQPTVEVIFDPFCGVRIGEATNPGPDKRKQQSPLRFVTLMQSYHIKKSYLGWDLILFLYLKPRLQRLHRPSFNITFFKMVSNVFGLPLLSPNIRLIKMIFHSEVNHSVQQ